MGKVNFPVIILVIALRMMNKVYLLYIILFQAISSVAIGALDSLAFKTDKKWSTIEGYQNEVLKIKFCVPNKEYWLNISSKKNRFEIINKLYQKPNQYRDIFVLYWSWKSKSKRGFFKSSERDTLPFVNQDSSFNFYETNVHLKDSVINSYEVYVYKKEVYKELIDQSVFKKSTLKLLFFRKENDSEDTYFYQSKYYNSSGDLKKVMYKNKEGEPLLYEEFYKKSKFIKRKILIE